MLGNLGQFGELELREDREDSITGLVVGSNFFEVENQVEGGIRTGIDLRATDAGSLFQSRFNPAHNFN